MKRWLHLFFLLALAVPVAWAAWIPFDGSLPRADSDLSEAYTIDVLASDAQSVSLDIRFHGTDVQPVELVGEIYSRFNMNGLFPNSRVGMPELPFLFGKVAIPAFSGARLQIVEREDISLGAFLVKPVQEPTVDRAEDAVFAIDAAYYAAGGDWPETVVELGDPVIWREVRLLPVILHPLQWNATSHELTAISHLQVDILFEGTDLVNAKRRPARPISPVWDALYRAGVWNYEFLDLPKEVNLGSREISLKYLIIADDSLVDHVNDFADWYNRSGLGVEIRLASEAGGTPAAITSFIQNYYDTYGIEYCLFVGDVSLIPIGSYSGSPSDHVYMLMEGGDYYPDIALGRICTTDPAQVDHQLLKALHYIQTPPAGNWVQKSILAAHEQEYPGKYTECKNYIKNYDYSLVDPIFDTCYPPEGCGDTNVTAAINEGRGIVNYRGHGDVTEWSWQDRWTTADVYALENEFYLPHVYNICCNNAWVDGATETLCEAWQNAGADGWGGAVTNFGATRPSYTIENHDLDKRLYKANFDEGINTIGYITNAGKDTMIGMSSNGIFNAHIYLVFGDPAIDIYTLEPQALDVTALEQIPMGAVDYEVTVLMAGVPVQNARVCCWKDGEVAEVGYTNASGQATIPVTPITTGAMDLTITAHNALPYIETVNVMITGCGVIQSSSETYNCSDLMEIKLWDADLNLNPGVLDEAEVTVFSTVEVDPETVVLTETGPDTGQFIGSIQLDESQSGPGYLQVTHADTITITYQDADCEGEPATVIEQATTDCEGPEITNTQAVEIGHDGATIQWVTEELSDSELHWGDTVPPVNIVSDEAYVTEHSFTITGLEACTYYYYEVASTDIFGNTTIDNNGGSYYLFMTKGRTLAMDQPLDSDPGWTTENLWAFGVPAGQGGEYGSPDPTAGHTGSNVYGYNLNGDYTNYMPVYNLTTTAIDCSEGTSVMLGFWRYLNVEQPIYDEAHIQVSNDGSNFHNIWSNQATIEDNSWELFEYDISEYADLQETVYIRWVMGPTDVGWTYSGWNIDDIQIYYDYECSGETPTPLPTFTPTQIPPTPTAIPKTPTMTPTVPPNPTETPVPPSATPNPPIPTATPTQPGPTATPTEPIPPTATSNPPIPTPTAVPGVPIPDLDLNQQIFHGNDPFLLLCTCRNPGNEIMVEQYIILDVYGNYWFWPSWNQEVSFVLRTLAAGAVVPETILEFTWPSDAGAASGILFWSAFLDPGTVNLVGDYDSVEFAYE